MLALRELYCDSSTQPDKEFPSTVTGSVFFGMEDKSDLSDPETTELIMCASSFVPELEETHLDLEEEEDLTDLDAQSIMSDFTMEEEM